MAHAGKRREFKEKHRLMLLRVVEKRIRDMSQTVGDLEAAHEARELQNPAASLLEASGASYEADCARMISAHEERMLKMLISARERLVRNTYTGRCKQCGDAIALERLKAVPESEYCKTHSI